MIKLGKGTALGNAARNMTREYPELSDSHVLMAGYEESIGHETNAREAFIRALDQGLPTCADGLMQLYEGVKRHKIQHQRVALLNEVFEYKVQGLLWTAFYHD